MGNPKKSKKKAKQHHEDPHEASGSAKSRRRSSAATVKDDDKPGVESSSQTAPDTPSSTEAKKSDANGKDGTKKDDPWGWDDKKDETVHTWTWNDAAKESSQDSTELKDKSEKPVDTGSWGAPAKETSTNSPKSKDKSTESNADWPGSDDADTNKPSSTIKGDTNKSDGDKDESSWDKMDDLQNKEDNKPESNKEDDKPESKSWKTISDALEKAKEFLRNYKDLAKTAGDNSSTKSKFDSDGGIVVTMEDGTELNLEEWTYLVRLYQHYDDQQWRLLSETFKEKAKVDIGVDELREKLGDPGWQPKEES